MDDEVHARSCAVKRAAKALRVAPNGDADHAALVNHGLDLLHGVVLIGLFVPVPDPAAR